MINTKNALNYIVLGGLFITPFIAFLVPSGMFFPFITGKGFAFRILVEIIFGLYIILAFLDKDYRPKFSWLTKSILLFTFIILVADLLGENVYKSIWSNYERMEGFVLLTHLVVYYLVLSSVFKTRDLWNRFFNTSIVASLGMSLYGLFQLFGWATISQGGVRLDGTFGNATYLAIYLVFHIFLSAYMLVSGKRETWQKWFYGSVIAIQTILLYYTATRGAILGLLGGLIIMGILLVWKERENKILRKASFVVLGSVVVVIFGFFLIKNTSFVQNSPVMSRFSTLSFSEFKTQGRYFVWPMALEGIKERPLLGWGQENFNFVFNKNYNPGLFGQEEWFDRTHNLFLDWFIAGGLLGFLSYLSIYLALFYYIWRKNSIFSFSEKSVLTGMVLAYVFHNIFVFDNLISYMIFFSILAYVHHMSQTNVSEVGDSTASVFYTKSFSQGTLNYFIAPAVTILTVMIVYYVNVPAIRANITLIQAMSQTDQEKSLNLFKKTFDYNSFGSSEALEHLTQRTIQIFSPQMQVSDSVKQNFFNFTKTKIEEKVSSVPNDARYLVFAGSFFNRFGQYDEAIKYLERALVESPKKQSIYFELGSAYLGKGDTKKTFELFKRAYDLKPTSKESQVIYAVGAIYTGNKEVLEELSEIIPEETIISDDRFVRAYSGIGDYNSAITILRARQAKDPNNLQDKYTLAEIYYKIGQKQSAVSLIREIIVLEPQFKDQGEAYIKQILSQ